jgi:hypothetical protein
MFDMLAVGIRNGEAVEKAAAHELVDAETRVLEMEDGLVGDALRRDVDARAREADGGFEHGELAPKPARLAGLSHRRLAMCWRPQSPPSCARHAPAVSPLRRRRSIKRCQQLARFRVIRRP